jgi:hypothetical protein
MSDQPLHAGMLALGRAGLPLRIAATALSIDPERAALRIAEAQVSPAPSRSAGELWRLAEPQPIGLG